MDTALLLRHINRHIQLNEEEADLLLSHIQLKTLKKKEFLLRQGDVCHTESFILKGCLRVYTIDDSGAEHILMFGIEDWWVGDLYSFLSGAKTEYYIDALEETELVQISKNNLDKLYELIPKLERFFRIIIQNAFISQQQRINQNLSLDAEQRYLQFLEKYPAFEQRIAQKQVAAYLGITPVFLSILRKKRSRGL